MAISVTVTDVTDRSDSDCRDQISTFISSLFSPQTGPRLSLTYVQYSTTEEGPPTNYPLGVNLLFLQALSKSESWCRNFSYLYLSCSKTKRNIYIQCRIGPKPDHIMGGHQRNQGPLSMNASRPRGVTIILASSPPRVRGNPSNLALGSPS